MWKLSRNKTEKILKKIFLKLPWKSGGKYTGFFIWLIKWVHVFLLNFFLISTIFVSQRVFAFFHNLKILYCQFKKKIFFRANCFCNLLYYLALFLIRHMKRNFCARGFVKFVLSYMVLYLFNKYLYLSNFRG